ncbi:hypothetical protein G6F57_015270 [Rhizopus arrhizus]|nr:hypothetical protein G6F57_015270 [Rhizopus arrhizus]
MHAEPFFAHEDRAVIAGRLRRARRCLRDKVDDIDLHRHNCLHGGGDGSQDSRRVDPPAEGQTLFQFDRLLVPVQIAVAIDTEAFDGSVLHLESERLVDFSLSHDRPPVEFENSAMTYIHPNDRVYALERALAAAVAQGEDRKVQDDLREILAEARREARG